MLSWGEILIRLSLASLFGGLIGLERERKHWAAGLRTHMMVSVGACLIMIVSAFGFADILGTDHVSLDPSRVAAQVVSGIGFLGAGAILFSKQGTVRGLTTAAGMWTVAAIGLAAGGGLYFAASAATVISLIILWALQPLERFYSRRFKHKSLKIVADYSISSMKLLQEILDKEGMQSHSFSYERNDDEVIYYLQVDNSDTSTVDLVMSNLKDNPSIKEISWN